jgi:O-antigen/teichoic acid export membrane protein
VKYFLLIKFLKLKSFDVSTEQGRTDERYRLAALTIVANVLSRLLAMTVMIFSVSLTIPYLGAERFGVWMTIASFTGMLSFLDLGIGNALTNKVAKIATQNNQIALRSLISGGLGFLLILGSVITIALISLASMLPWEMLIKARNVELYTEIRQVAILFACIFGFQIFTNGIHRIFAGLQRAFESHLINLVGSAISLCCLFFAAQKHAGIGHLLLATFGIQVFVSLILIIFLYKRNQISSIDLISNIKTEIPSLIKIGGLFFILQIGVMLSTGADSIIISSNLGVEHVTAFSLVQRLFQFASQPIGIMNAPLWSAYADADSRGEKKFIKNTLKISLKNSFIFITLATCFLVFFGSKIIQNWTNNEVFISKSFLLIYGCWVILEVTGNALGVFLNGCGIVRQQVINVVVFSFISIAAKLYSIKYYGVEAMILCLVLSYAVVTISMYGFFFRDVIREKIE